MRGKPGCIDQPSRSLRLIPACAGKTSEQMPKQRCDGAHPRVCGENNSRKMAPNPSGGSSPRVRGKHGLKRHVLKRHGLIPACAGKTACHLVCQLHVRAHPRVCGENFEWENYWRDQRGSSPRVRGKPGRSAPAYLRAGLIPACAGKTRRLRHRARGFGAHPRVCGENRRVVDCGELREGSSPRVRGKLSARTSETLADGLIPACAGKTRPAATRKAKTTAHPRVCGENGSH